jgi:hypothetical protein
MRKTGPVSRRERRSTIANLRFQFFKALTTNFQFKSFFGTETEGVKLGALVVKITAKLAKRAAGRVAVGAAGKFGACVFGHNRKSFRQQVTFQKKFRRFSKKIFAVFLKKEERKTFKRTFSISRP